MKSSPWGHVQDCTQVAPEIIRVSTASHGGYHCTGAAQKRIEALFPGFTPYAGRGWYEEDCDWAIVALAHRAYFEDRSVYHALKTVQGGSPGYFTAIRDWLEANSLDAKSVQAKAARYLEEHGEEYEVGSLCSPPQSAPANSWSVSFRRIADGHQRRIIVMAYPQCQTYTDEDLDQLDASVAAD
jgi:hypothetical protein